jgi:MFS family permease
MKRRALVVLILHWTSIHNHHQSCAAFAPSVRLASLNAAGRHKTFDDTSSTRALLRYFRNDRSATVRILPAISNNQDEKGEKGSPLSWLWKLCLPLWLVYISNQWSRSSLYYLVDFSDAAVSTTAMNVDIGFDQVQYGVLASLAFTSLFAIASLGAGIAADRSNRKLLTVVAAGTWVIATVATAAADSYDTVLLSRVAMGLACAFSTPTAYTLIRERAPADRVALATSLYGTGVAVAGGLASLTILLDAAVGWRSALDIVAIFGVTAAVVTALLLEDDPKEQKGSSANLENNESKDPTKNDAVAEVFADISQVLATNRVKWIFLGSFLRFCSGLCIGVWSAPFYRLLFTENQSDYAIAQAVISAGLATLSGLIGGSVADWLSSQAAKEGKSDVVGRRLWVPVVGSAIAAPAWYFAVQTDNSFDSAMTWLAIEYLVAECWFGPTISTLQSTVGPRIGGTAQGMFTVTGAFANLAPSAVGVLYGQLGTPVELSHILEIGVCFGYLSSAACFAFACQDAEEKGGTVR